jgi:hypothetical protein
MRKVVVVDNTQSHYDGRIRPIQHSHSKASFQRDNIKYAYFIGHDRFGGRTNNELLAVLRALDLLFDRHGQGKNSNAILVICGWAQDMLKGFFFNETNLQDWALKLEQVTPYIIATDRLGSLHRIPLLLKNFTGENYFRYHSNPQHDTLSKNEILKQRRNLILGPLFRNPSAEKMQGYHMLKQHLAGMAAANDKLLPDTYMAVHSRWLEGTCRQRVGNLLPHDECTMKPGYVKRILEKMDMLSRVAVVVITDMQNEQVIELLKNDTEIGNHVIVPALDIKGWSNDAHPATDMMVAIHSHAFVGTRVSSMALMIGLARNAIGKDPLTNFVYVDKDLNVCQECLYYCNAKRTSLCGGG